MTQCLFPGTGPVVFLFFLLPLRLIRPLLKVVPSRKQHSNLSSILPVCLDDSSGFILVERLFPWKRSVAERIISGREDSVPAGFPSIFFRPAFILISSSLRILKFSASIELDLNQVKPALHFYSDRLEWNPLPTPQA